MRPSIASAIRCINPSSAGPAPAAPPAAWLASGCAPVCAGGTPITAPTMFPNAPAAVLASAVP
eukprot:14908128-Alexandrium_andersonii.AAC.1